MNTELINKITLTELINAGAVIKDKEEYQVIKYKGLEFEIGQEEYCDYLFDELKENDEVFLVNYHRDFWVKKDDIITEEETAALYRKEIDWKKTEREKGYWIFKLGCLVHGGVWLRLGEGGFVSDPEGWDTSHVGLVLVSKKLAKTRKKAEKLAEDLVDYYNSLSFGDIYHIVIKKNNKEIDLVGPIVGLDKVYSFIKEYKQR